MFKQKQKTLEQSSRTTIADYFEHILKSVQLMNKHVRVFSELETVAQELTELEQYVHTAFQTLERHFQKYLGQINLFSDLIDFQRSLQKITDPFQAYDLLFSFIQKHVPYQMAFFHLKGEKASQSVVIHRSEESEELLADVTAKNMEPIHRLMAHHDMALLLDSLEQFDLTKKWKNQFHWQTALLLPLRLRNQYLGCGIFLGEESAFNGSHLSFMNVVLGLVTYVIYQHHFYTQFKRKLLQQLKYQKILEEFDYAEYIDKGPLFIWILDTRGIILQVNQKVCRLLGVEEEKLIGEKFLSFIPEYHKKPLQNRFLKLTEEEVDYYLCPVLLPDGQEHYLEFYLARSHLKNEVDFIVVLAVDASLQFWKSKWEKRNELLDEITQFAQSVYGQMNSFLNVVVPNVSLMKAHLPSDSPLQKNLQIVEDALNQTSRMLQRFLNFGLPELEPLQTVQVNQLLKEIVQEWQGRLPANVHVQLSLEPGLPKLELHPGRFRQLISLLLQNSLDAIRDEGEIQIRTRKVSFPQDTLVKEGKFFVRAGDYLELIIEDNGNGIDPGLMDNVFKPFFSTKIQNQMMGLGLFIAYNIVKDFEGEIFIHSKEDEFTRVHIFFPLQGERPMYDVVQRMEEKTAVQPVHILVVDDEYNIRVMLKEVLEMKQFQVSTASNGKEALEIFKKHVDDIELVILDMVMPIMDGYATFKEIKKIKPDQKVLIISGYAKRPSLDEILKAKSSAFMRKPFQIDEILFKVQEMLRKN